MKKLLSILFLSLCIACNNSSETKTDNEKMESSEAAEAADTSSLIEKVDSTMKDAADTINKNVVEPMKKDIKKASEKVREAVKEMKEEIKQ